MTEDNRKCYNCKFFERYYVKDVKRYNKISLGRCRSIRDTVNSHGTCSDFTFKRYSRKSYMSIKYYLSDLLTEIHEIRNIIEDDINGNKDV